MINIACGEVCIGCKLCVRICPGNWKMVGNKSQPIHREIENTGFNALAASHCPMGRIQISGV